MTGPFRVVMYLMLASMWMAYDFAYLRQRRLLDIPLSDADLARIHSRWGRHCLWIWLICLVLSIPALLIECPPDPYSHGSQAILAALLCLTISESVRGWLSVLRRRVYVGGHTSAPELRGAANAYLLGMRGAFNAYLLDSSGLRIVSWTVLAAVYAAGAWRYVEALLSGSPRFAFD